MMQVYVIEVRYGNVQRGIEKIIRYAVLCRSPDKALDIMRDRFGHSDRVQISEEVLSDEEAYKLDLKPDMPRVIEIYVG